ncbi:MAG: dienelactone hydrolase family protein [Dehalococcoidia bacterium]|nr:dienelactone hydrolase family protein [Dehalococcoidia bacterium]
MTAFLADGPADAPVTLVLAHGAGAPMDSAFMDTFAAGLGQRGLRVVRFEFPYMQARRESGSRRPPDREAVLLQAWRTVFAELGGAVAVGGKSMGGRMASMVADELGARALVCLGYPFHAPGRPGKPRIAHLAGLRTPALIVQGTRDPFGGRDDVATYDLSPSIEIHWVEDGDHDLAPRKAAGGRAAAWEGAMDAVAAFLGRLP